MERERESLSRLGGSAIMLSTGRSLQGTRCGEKTFTGLSHVLAFGKEISNISAFWEDLNDEGCSYVL